MYEATYELLERLTSPLIESIRNKLRVHPACDEGQAILADAHHLEDLLRQAEVELKGGA